METMYPGKVNSPATTLDGGINNIITTINVVDGSVLPNAPNLAVMGIGEDAETILYATKIGNVLSNITRGFQGVAKSWTTGEIIARLFTEYDYNALIGNLEEVVDRKITDFAEVTSAELAGKISDETGSGKAVFGNNPTINKINLTEGQIIFPAIPNPSANVNTLDEYEEGTWTVTITPATSGSVTLDSNFDTGRYTKIGSLVHAHGQIKIASVSSPVGYAKVNLPFASADLIKASEKAMGNIALGGVNYTVTGWLTTDISGGNAFFYLLGIQDNVPWIYELANIFSAGDYMGFTITYVTE